MAGKEKVARLVQERRQVRVLEKRDRLRGRLECAAGWLVERAGLVAGGCLVERRPGLEAERRHDPRHQRGDAVDVEPGALRGGADVGADQVDILRIHRRGEAVDFGQLQRDRIARRGDGGLLRGLLHGCSRQQRVDLGLQMLVGLVGRRLGRGHRVGRTARVLHEQLGRGCAGDVSREVGDGDADVAAGGGGLGELRTDRGHGLDELRQVGRRHRLLERGRVDEHLGAVGHLVGHLGELRRVAVAKFALRRGLVDLTELHRVRLRLAGLGHAFAHLAAGDARHLGRSRKGLADNLSQDVARLERLTCCELAACLADAAHDSLHRRLNCEVRELASDWCFRQARGHGLRQRQLARQATGYAVDGTDDRCMRHRLRCNPLHQPGVLRRGLERIGAVDVHTLAGQALEQAAAVVGREAAGASNSGTSGGAAEQRGRYRGDEPGRGLDQGLGPDRSDELHRITRERRHGLAPAFGLHDLLHDRG